ncbi:hypothetical protein Hanom_Chr00s066471g01787171 [Helianthus anomalus]
MLSGCEMTKIPFPLKGQTTWTIRASSTFLEKNPTTAPPHLLSGDITMETPATLIVAID